MAPYGVILCADGSWSAWSVVDDDQWRRLCDLGAATSLTNEYATASGRLTRAEALDAELSLLTAGHDVDDLVRRLQCAGIPAGKSATAPDVIADERLGLGECYRFVSDHREGQRPVLGAPWKMSTYEALIEHGAPDLANTTRTCLATSSADSARRVREDGHCPPRHSPKPSPW